MADAIGVYLDCWVRRILTASVAARRDSTSRIFSRSFRLGPSSSGAVIAASIIPMLVVISLRIPLPELIKTLLKALT